jgi:hypothetical protein
MSILSFGLKDDAGVRGTATLFLDHATSLTVAQLAVQAIAIGSMIDAITAAEIETVSLTLLITPDAGWKASPVADVDMEQNLLLSFQIGATPYSDAVNVPALRDTLIVDGRPVLTASGAIDDLRQAVSAGTGLTGVTIETKLLDAMTDLQSAAVTFRSKRKGRKAVSKVIVTS